MKREEIKGIIEGITDKQINSLLDLYGKGVNKAKSDYDTLKNDLKNAQDTVTNLTSELNTLKDSNASAEDWKNKFETLQNEIAEKEKTAKEEQAKAEKMANITKRFDGCVGDKKFTHEAIRESYLSKFAEALEIAENQGKSDGDVFNDLTKDDATAFIGVQQLNLPGGKPFSSNVTKDDFMKMGYADRLKIHNENPDMYNSFIQN